MEEQISDTRLFADELERIATELLGEEEIDDVCAKSSVYAFELIRNPHISNAKKKEIAYQFVCEHTTVVEQTLFVRHIAKHVGRDLLQLMRDDIRFPIEVEFQNLLVFE